MGIICETLLCWAIITSTKHFFLRQGSRNKTFGPILSLILLYRQSCRVRRIIIFTPSSACMFEIGHKNICEDFLYVADATQFQNWIGFEKKCEPSLIVDQSHTLVRGNFRSHIQNRFRTFHNNSIGLRPALRLGHPSYKVIFCWIMNSPLHQRLKDVQRCPRVEAIK